LKIIDAHIHIGKWSSVFLDYETNVKDAVKVLKESGIDSAVALPCDTFMNQELLDEIKKEKNYKFHFACWINPDDNNLDAFIEKNIKEIKVFKIHPSFQKKRVTDTAYSKYLDIAESKNIPVIVHCGRWQDIASFTFPIEAAKKRKNLNLILAHMGGDQPNLVTDCANAVKESGLKNLFLGTESVREFHFVNEAVKIAGAERVIFGSDYNLGLPKMYIPIIESLKISNEEKELIFSRNISRLLGIE
jgi:uncharacterized protein